MRLANFALVVALFIGCSRHETVSLPGRNVPITDANILASPYVWRSDPVSLTSVNPGSYVKLGFTGTSLKANLSAGAFTGTSLRLRAIVDNVETYNTAVGNGTTQITLATGLASGTHQATVWYDADDPTQDVWTTPVMACVITSFTIDGGAASAAPPLRTKRMLVLGDSVSYGIAVLRSTSHPAGDAGSLSPFVAVAEAFDAEVGIVGFGSQGYGKTGLGNAPIVYNTSTPSLSGWLNYSSGNSRLVSSLLSPAPDYIVCYHGTADYTGSASGVNVTAGVAGLLPALRTAAPLAKIFCVVPANRQYLSYITSGFETAFTAKTLIGTSGPVTAWKGSSDANAFLIDLGAELSNGLDTDGGGATWAAIDDIHPDAAANGRVSSCIVAGMRLALSGSSAGGIFNPFSSPLIRGVQ